MPPERLGFGQLIEEFDGAPMAEAASNVITEGGLWDSDGNGRVAIIRPCVSRGRRIRKLPPVYTPQMLEANADVFKGWPMYLDHLMEQALEEMAAQLAEHEDLSAWLQERARSVKELGGRILETHWDPDVTFEDDAEYGYQPGAIVGVYRPQPMIREMLEADPGLLNVSINAYPTGARPGTAPWKPSLRGMLIEGIRRKPMGSVDWVFRGGAGGRPLLQEGDMADRALALLEAGADAEGVSHAGRSYRSRRSKERTVGRRDLSQMTAAELREALREDNPDLAAEVLEVNGGGDEPLSEARVIEIVQEANASLLDEIGARIDEGGVEERAEALLQEREEARRLERKAHAWIEEAVRNGLPRRAGEELKTKYAVLPSGPTPALLVEAEEDGENPRSVEEVLKEQVAADVSHFVDLLVESGSPVQVKGLGASSTDPNGESGKRPRRRDSAFRSWLRESGDLPADTKPEDEDGKVTEILREGL